MVAAAAGVPAVAAMALEAALAGVLAAALQVRAARASASRVPAALLDQHLGRGLVPSCRGLRRRAPWAHGNDMRAPGDDSQPGPPPTTPRQTGTTTAPSSTPPWPHSGYGCCARPAKANMNAPARTCSSPCARPSNRSIRPSGASSTSNAPAGTRPPGSWCASCSGFCPDRGDLTQRPHRRTGPPLAHRLRPLTFA